MLFFKKNKVVFLNHQGAKLEAMILETTTLGVEGTSPTIRIIEGSNAVKAEELFATLTRDALSKTTQTNGAIVADMGNGNYITFRPLSASTSGFPASINFNYQELLGTNNFVIKFP